MHSHECCLAYRPGPSVLQLLCTISPAEVVSLSGRLQSVSARAALLSGLCSAQGPGLSAARYSQLYRHAAGLMVLGLLGAGWTHYQHLATRPELIVIQLICNQYFQVGTRLYTVCNQHFQVGTRLYTVCNQHFQVGTWPYMFCN